MSDAAMIVAGAVACLGLAGAGSAFGTGFAAAAAVGAWKKCYAANKPAPFLLLSFVGAPITQTLYGMILMFIMLDKVGKALEDANARYHEALGKLGLEPGAQNIITPAKELIRLTESTEKRNAKLLKP